VFPIRLRARYYVRANEKTRHHHSIAPPAIAVQGEMGFHDIYTFARGRSRPHGLVNSSPDLALYSLVQFRVSPKMRLCPLNVRVER
jgi:hypothetical protein